MSYWMIWLIIVILLVVIEAATVNLVSVWFIASGILALFVSLFCESFLIQFGIFVLLGILLLVLTRPMLIKMVSLKEQQTNLERIIGMEGIVTSKISKNIIGEVKVDGKLWSAVSDKSIKEGSIVKVTRIDSVKLVVEKVEEEKPERVSSPKKKTTSTKKSSSSGVKKKTESKAVKKKAPAKTNSVNKKKVSE